MESTYLAKINVVCVGTGALTVIGLLAVDKPEELRLVAVDCAGEALEACRADTRIALPAAEAGGPLAAAVQNEDYLRAAVTGSDLLIVVSCLGGQTGTAVAPLIAELTRTGPELVVSLVTIPFTFELGRQGFALQSLSAFAGSTTIVIPLEQTGPMRSREDPFSRAGGFLARAVRGITDPLLRAGMVNLDFCDARYIFEGTRLGAIGFGIGFGDDRASFAGRAALDGLLIEHSLSLEPRSADRLFLHVRGPEDLGLFEINEAVKAATEASGELDPIWSAAVPGDADEVKVTAFVLWSSAAGGGAYASGAVLPRPGGPDRSSKTSP